MSLRDKIVSQPPAFRRKLVEVPEWDAKLEVRSLSVAAKVALGRFTDSEDDPAGVMGHLILSCVFDPETGEKVFSDSDVEWLAQQDSAVVERVAEMALEVSGLKQSAEKVLDDPKDDSSKIKNTDTSTNSPES